MELRPPQRVRPEVAGVPIFNATPEEWVKRVSLAYGKVSWTTLHVSERKESLLFLYDSKDKPRFVEVVQHVLQHYPDCDIEDFEGEVNLLLVLPTSQALKVVKFNCCRALSLTHVPGLMKKGITPQKLEKLLRASQEGGRRRWKGVLPGIPEDRVGFDETPGMPESSGRLCADGPKRHELSLQLESFQLKLTLTSASVKAYIDSVLLETYRPTCKHLDSYVQRMLSLCESHVDLNECSTSHHGTVLHAAAKFGLVESAREILAQGYCNMLLENDGDKPNSWPLVYAVRSKQWSTVKVLLETLSAGQRQSQIRVLLETIDYTDVLQELSEYRKSWWLFCRRHRSLHEKLQNEGRLLLLRCVLDTMIKGCEVDPALVYDDEPDDIPSNTGGGGGGRTGSGSARPTEQQDGANVTESGKKSLYRLISESHVEELKCHPSFAAIVQHKWKTKYFACWHLLLFGMYIVFLFLFTTGLSLAAQSPNPRSYTSPKDFLRLFILEILCLLYILVVLGGDLILFIDEVNCRVHSQKKIFDLLTEKIRWYFFFELLRYLSILLLVILRLANDPHQWWMASLAIILCGLRIFHYATVLPFMDKYVGTLILIAKHDVPRLLGVFLVINFSFGSGLYFALVGHYNEGNSDVVNENYTSEVYYLWLTGVRMVIEESVLTYIGPDGFNFPGRLVYWLFVFCVTVAFAAILIAQIEISFNTLSNRAKMNVILKKLEIMHKMERFRDVFGCVLRRTPCMMLACRNNREETDSEESDESQQSIKRQAWDDLDNLEVKDYVVSKLSRKLAENDKRVQTLENKMDKIYNLLQSLKEN